MPDSSVKQPCDYFLHKAIKRLKLLEDLSEHDEELPMAVESFLCAVVETYGEIGELTSADKQQVSAKRTAVREMCVQCSHELKGGAFDGAKWKCSAKAVFEGLSQTMNEARCRQILRQLQMCEHNLSDINKCKFTEIVLTNFRRLIGNTARLLEFLYKYIQLGTIKGKRLQDALLLCSLQIQKCFPLLLHVLENDNHGSGHCHEAKEYLVQRMKFCFHKVQCLIHDGDDEKVEEDLGGGLFILHMDQALSLLAVFDSSTTFKPACDNWHDCVQNVLQHAMLIAQVASQFDFKMIRGSSEKILRESDNLMRECKSAPINPAVCKLYANTVSDALEELEQRVCAAVLRLYLQVFSDPFSPLQELCTRCWVDPSPEEERKADDLTNLVAAFDAHADCIIQVALFSIACSNDEKRVLGIRSCLASLESLEPQLVPALSALYIRQNTPKWDFVHMLVQHWNCEVKELWKLIDGIIDSAALAQVTRDAIWVPTSTLKKALDKKQALPQQELSALVRSVVSKVSVFAGQLLLTFEEFSLIKNSSLGKQFDDLLRAVREGEAVLLLIQQDSSTVTVSRILKRCELLVSCVQRIQPLLEELVEPKDWICSSPDGKAEFCNSALNATGDDCAISLKKKQYSRLGINLPSDIDIELDVTDTCAERNREHSLLNNTSTLPRFTTSFLYKDQSVPRTPITHASTRGSLRCYIFSRKKHQSELSQNLLQETLCLDVTNILDGLSTPSQTPHKRKETTCTSEVDGSKPFRVINSSFNEGRSQRPSQFSCSSFASGEINTPERIRDLLHVQERIDAVKMSSVGNSGSNSQPVL